jgi:cytochrome P450
VDLLYLLSQHPTVDDRLYDELQSVLGSGIITVQDVPKLVYTEKVLRESMRLYPPTWTIGRQAMNDYKVDKYVITAGSIILMSQYVMHRNQNYYSDPNIFYPDRWTKEAKLQMHRFSYFPFGGGILEVA